MKSDNDVKEFNIEEFKKAESEMFNFRDKIKKKYGSIVTAIEFTGIVGFFIALVFKLWLLAFLLWFAFFPDLDKIVRYVKRIFVK